MIEQDFMVLGKLIFSLAVIMYCSVNTLVKIKTILKIKKVKKHTLVNLN